MDTRPYETSLAKKFNYKNLDPESSKVMREFYTGNIPEFLNTKGSDSQILYTVNGSEITKGYCRVVVGDYGAFVEFEKLYNPDIVVIKPGQEYRVNNPRYSNHCKYNWMTILDGSDVKIYYQKRAVTYADYIPGKYYVSVHEIKDQV